MIFYDLSPDFATASAQMRNFYGESFVEQIKDANAGEIFTFPEGWSPVETALTKLICDTYLRENGITQGDRLGMASSVEMRLPLVDYKFVETVVGLRKKHPDSTLPPKHWLKEAVKDVLPEWVLNRPKRGFAPPTRAWHDALFAAYGDGLRDGYLVESDVLNPESAARFAEGEFPADATSPLSFKALVLEYWCRRMQRIIPSI
jgi:asparagine synthase (glutamine-hydrolysing)